MSAVKLFHPSRKVSVIAIFAATGAANTHPGISSRLINIAEVENHPQNGAK